MRAEKFFGCLTAVIFMLSATCAPPQRGNASGGGSGQPGSSASGGSGSAGGILGSGGIGGTGGTGSTGGSAIGGGAGSGGIIGTGGGAGGGSFGSSASGGATFSGGASGKGGVTTSGGLTAAGGRSGSGGVTSAGGAGGSGTCAVTSSLKWSSSDSLMNVIRDGSHMDLNAIKSPSVVLYNSHYDLYATVSDTSGNTNLQFITFTAWASSGSATGTFFDNLANFTGSHASPQLFYLNAQKKWYLISQSSGPGYSTASAPDQPATWTKPTSFFSSTPSIVTQNAGSGSVGWADFWVICDSTNCHLFFTNQNGYLFRSQTTVGNFPNSFGTPVVVMHGTDANSLYESSSVYKIKGTSKYLLLVAAVGTTGRYYRSWTADALDTSSWTALADSESAPFAGASNVTFSGTLWTKDFVGGEVVRDGYDETMTIDPCNLQVVFQGKDPYATTTGNAVEWRLGLLTRTN